MRWGFATQTHATKCNCVPVLLALKAMAKDGILNLTIYHMDVCDFDGEGGLEPISDVAVFEDVEVLPCAPESTSLPCENLWCWRG